MKTKILICAVLFLARLIPPDRVDEATKAGWEHATKMQNPEGQNQWIPNSRISEAASGGYTPLGTPLLASAPGAPSSQQVVPGEPSRVGSALNALTPTFTSKPLAPPEQVAKTYNASGDPRRVPGGVLGPVGYAEQGYGTNKEQAIRAAQSVGSAISDVAPVVSFGASLPVQTAVMAGSGALGSKSEGGTNLDALKRAALQAAVPPLAEYAGPALGKISSYLGDVFGGLPGEPTLAGGPKPGEAFQTIETAAKHAPVETSAARRIAEQAKEYEDTGSGSMPQVLKKYLQRTEPTPGVFPEPHTPAPSVLYPESRKFAENAGRLSAQEIMEAKPQMQRLTSQFAQALKTANRAAAESVGMGDAYDDAMEAYAKSKGREEMLANVKDVAKKYVFRTMLQGMGLGAGYDIYHLLFGK